MPSVNKVILVGNLGDAPQLAATASNRPVAKVSLATNQKWKDKVTGEKREQATWHRLIFFDRLAEVANQYLQKGMPIYVEGRLNNRQWQDDQGITRYITEVVVGKLEMLGGGGNTEQNQAPSYPQQQQQQPQHSAPPGGFDNDYDDDIPF